MSTVARLFWALPLLVLGSLGGSCATGGSTSSPPTTPTTLSFDFATADPCRLLTDQQQQDEGLSSGQPLSATTDARGCVWSQRFTATSDPLDRERYSVVVTLWDKQVDRMASALSGSRTIAAHDPIAGHPAYTDDSTGMAAECGFFIGLGPSATVEVSIGYIFTPPSACQTRLPRLAALVVAELRVT